MVVIVMMVMIVGIQELNQPINKSTNQQILQVTQQSQATVE
jgi:hypothetical protein